MKKALIKFWGMYTRLLVEHPYKTKACETGTIFGFSDFTVQH